MTDSRPATGAAADQTGQPTQPSVGELYLLALGELRAGRPPLAQAYCREALARDDNHADTLHLMGLISLQAEQYEQAISWFSRAIRTEPKPTYLSSLGTCLSRQNRHEEALQVFDKAVQLRPEDANLWHDLGQALLALGRTSDALLAFQHARKLDPRHWQATNQCAVLLQGFDRVEEALACLEACDALRPDDVLTLQRRAACLSRLKRFEEALVLCHQAHALAPEDARGLNNIGTVLRSLGRDRDSVPWFDRALAMAPGFRDPLHNKAAALAKLRRFDDAIVLYRRLLADDPADALAALGIAHLQLLTGDFAAGWAGREVRRAILRNYPQFARPVWLGQESLEGKTIVVVADEGLGDTIQFVRYVPMLADRGARVILVVQDPLRRLLGQLPGIAQCFPMSAVRLPPFDFHCPIMSLPLAFGTTLETVPSVVPYLPPPDASQVATWNERLGAHRKMRIGLCWAGNPRQPDDHNRSIALNTFFCLLGLDATFISVQKDVKAGDRALIADSAIVDLTADLTDFAETAALLTCLDLVISVETSVAHLSGAMARKTWTLLCYTPDHRWLLDRDGSPWYPTMRLFRQSAPGEWAAVLERVRGELELEIASFGATVASPGPIEPGQKFEPGED